MNDHPETIFTVLTGEGRFFSAGADVKGIAGGSGENYKNDAEKKLGYLGRFSYGMSSRSLIWQPRKSVMSITSPSANKPLATELLRSMIDHKKVLILALNGPAVGGGAAWFPGIADIVLASSTAWLQCPFSALGLVPENGSALSFAQSMGIHRANDFLMFGRKLSAQELLDAGMYNYVWDTTGDEFQSKVVGFLEEQLKTNDGKSMIEMKRLQNAPIRDARLIAVVNAVDALAERFTEGAPMERFAIKKREMDEKSKARAKI